VATRRAIRHTPCVSFTIDKSTGNQYITIGFEWDDNKAARNLRVHRVSFEQTAVACRDPFAIDVIDTREDDGEERSGLLGLHGHDVLYVAYTERGDNIRIIMARRAEKHEQDRYYRENAP
jgi:uncharacterized DUF497 family protein